MANATLSEVRSIYNDVLGRDFDPNRDGWWLNQGAAPADVVRQNVMLGDEYKAKPTGLYNPGGFLTPTPGSAGDTALRGGQVVGGVMYNPNQGVVYSPYRGPQAPPTAPAPITGAAPTPAVVQPATPAAPRGGGAAATQPMNASSGFTPPPLEDASVQRQLSGFLASNSPVMQQARTGAMQYANSRGVLNSSIAAGAGEDAVIRSAVPVASQDAAQINQRNLASLGFAYDSGLQAARIGSAERISDADIAARAALQTGQIASTERLSAAEIAARAALQQGQIGSTERLSASEIASQERIETNRLTANLASGDRQAVTTAVERAFSDYTSKVTSLAANNEVPAETRTAYMQAYAAERDRAIALIESVYNVDLPWAPVAVAATGG